MEDGRPSADVVDFVLGADAIPVLPWGFGKWLGARRMVVLDLIQDFCQQPFYLGDNGGRPTILPRPKEFELAESAGVRILPGSDPLPFKSEFAKGGSFGFYVECRPDSDNIRDTVISMLKNREGELHPFGLLETPFRFLRNQIAMQYVTRWGHGRR
jgi:hypothetical protein